MWVDLAGSRRRERAIPRSLAINVPLIMLFVMGVIIPMISFRRGLGEAYASLWGRIAFVDILVVLYVLTVLIPQGMRVHGAGFIYFCAMTIAFCVGQIRHVPADGGNVFAAYFALVMAFLYWVLGYNLANQPDRIRAFLLGLLVSVAWEIVIVGHDYLMVPQWFVDEMPGRARGTFRASGQLGSYGFSLVGLFLVFGWTMFKTRWMRVIVIAGGASGFFFVLAASRRSALLTLGVWLAFALGLLVIRIKNPQYVISIAIIGVAVLLFAGYAISNSNSFAVSRVREGVTTVTTSDSFMALQFKSIINHSSTWFPFGLGTGRGDHVDYTHTYEIHDGHLALLVEDGVLGVLSFYLLVAQSLCRRWPVGNDAQKKLIRNLALAFIVIGLVAMIHNTFHRDRGFMLFLGITAQLYQQDATAARKEEAPVGTA